MIIAVAKEGNEVSQHFGYCTGFEIFNIQNGEIKENNYSENPGHRPGFLPEFLAKKNVNVIISGGMGTSAQELFRKNNIKVIVGAKGDITDIINKYINEELESTDEQCNLHEHGKDHDCK